MALQAPLKPRNLDAMEFLPGMIQSKLCQSQLEKIRIKYHILLEFEMKVSLESNQACTPLSRIALYKKYFPIGLRLPLFPFFANFLHVVRLPPCTLVPNAWRFICGFTIICILVEVWLIVPLFRAFFILEKHPCFNGWWYIYLIKRKGC